jgi:hypothetical protein
MSNNECNFLFNQGAYKGKICKNIYIECDRKTHRLSSNVFNKILIEKKISEKTKVKTEIVSETVALIDNNDLSNQPVDNSNKQINDLSNKLDKYMEFQENKNSKKKRKKKNNSCNNCNNCDTCKTVIIPLSKIDYKLDSSRIKGYLRQGKNGDINYLKYVLIHNKDIEEYSVRCVDYDKDLFKYYENDKWNFESGENIFNYMLDKIQNQYIKENNKICNEFTEEQYKTGNGNICNMATYGNNLDKILRTFTNGYSSDVTKKMSIFLT